MIMNFGEVRQALNLTKKNYRLMYKWLDNIGCDYIKGYVLRDEFEEKLRAFMKEGRNLA